MITDSTYQRGRIVIEEIVPQNVPGRMEGRKRRFKDVFKRKQEKRRTHTYPWTRPGAAADGQRKRRISRMIRLQDVSLLEKAPSSLSAPPPRISDPRPRERQPRKPRLTSLVYRICQALPSPVILLCPIMSSTSPIPSR